MTSSFSTLSPLRAYTSSAVSHDPLDRDEDLSRDELISPQQISNFDWETSAAATEQENHSDNYDWTQQQQSERPILMPHLVGGINHPKAFRRSSCPGFIQTTGDSCIDVFSSHQPLAHAVDTAIVQQPTFNPNEDKSFPPPGIAMRRNSMSTVQCASAQVELHRAFSAAMQRHSDHKLNHTMDLPNREEIFSGFDATPIHSVTASSQGLILEQQPKQNDKVVFDQGLILQQRLQLYEPSEVNSDQKILAAYPARVSITSEKGILDQDLFLQEQQQQNESNLLYSDPKILDDNPSPSGLSHQHQHHESNLLYSDFDGHSSGLFISSDLGIVDQGVILEQEKCEPGQVSSDPNILPVHPTTTGSSSIPSETGNFNPGLFLEQQQHDSIQQYRDPNILANHATRLSIPSDKGFLDPVHNFIRSECIEVFVATDQKTGRGAKAHCFGQVGIRCIHCKHIPRKERANQAVSFPSKTINIFESVRNFQRTHFQACEHIPEELRAECRELSLVTHKKVQQKYIRAYYAEAGSEIGLVDTTKNGIVFGAPPNLSGKPSKKLQDIMQIAEDPLASAHLEALLFPKVDRRLVNMKFSHICSENTRQVIAKCRQRKTVFVHPSDFPTISDFRFVLYHQFCPCRPPSKALSRRKIRPEKWKTLSGLCCQHCARARPGERYHKGMYFPLDLESLHDSSFSHNLIAHLMTCEHAPSEVKAALAELQRLATENGVITKRGTKKKFMKKLWERMTTYYPAP